MTTLTASPASTSSPPHASPLVMRVLGACALAHLLNDLIQAVLPSIYPMLKADYGLTFTQVGLITLTFQLTASLLQPWVGYHTDRHPKPWLLPAAWCAPWWHPDAGICRQLPGDPARGGLVGVGSSTFHPETSRVARLASGGRYGLAQSTFQVGGNTGSPSAHCWRRRSSFPMARATWPGSGCLRCSRSWCSTGQPLVP
jgi:FSR family fosmidomycin resistance protein-like MFS transporter